MKGEIKSKWVVFEIINGQMMPVLNFAASELIDGKYPVKQFDKRELADKYASLNFKEFVIIEIGATIVNYFLSAKKEKPFNKLVQED